VNKQTTCLLVALAALSMSACANIKVRRVENAHGSSGIALAPDATGVRFFRPRLHVWLTNTAPLDKVNLKTSVAQQVTKDTSAADKEVTSTKSDTVVTPITGAASYRAEFTWLPDYSEEYVITWEAGIGSVDPSFTLTDGWNLTGFASSVDSKFSDNLSAVASLATAAAGALSAHSNFKGAGLYQMDVDPSGVLSLGKRVLALE